MLNISMTITSHADALQAQAVLDALMLPTDTEVEPEAEPEVAADPAPKKRTRRTKKTEPVAEAAPEKADTATTAPNPVDDIDIGIGSPEPEAPVVDLETETPGSFTPAQVREAMTAFGRKNKPAALLELFKRHGVSSMAEIPESKYPAIMAEIAA